MNGKPGDGTMQARLEARGWKRMNTYDEPRLSELVESYRELGYEVHLEPFHPEEDEDCTECLAAEPERFRTIYIRNILGRRSS
jgi:hypothetical protein